MSIAMAASVATRSTILRTIARSKATFSDSLTAAKTATRCPIRSTSVLRPSQISPTPSAPSRLIRRELSSLLPLHTAIASACLVSKIPSDLNSSTESAAFIYIALAFGLALIWHFTTQCQCLPTISLPSSSCGFHGWPLCSSGTPLMFKTTLLFIFLNAVTCSGTGNQLI